MTVHCVLLVNSVFTDIFYSSVKCNFNSWVQFISGVLGILKSKTGIRAMKVLNISLVKFLQCASFYIRPARNS